VCVCVCIGERLSIPRSLSLFLCTRDKSLPLPVRERHTLYLPERERHSLYLSICMRERESARATELLAELEEMEEEAKWRRESDP